MQATTKFYLVGNCNGGIAAVSLQFDQKHLSDGRDCSSNNENRIDAAPVSATIEIVDSERANMHDIGKSEYEYC